MKWGHYVESAVGAYLISQAYRLQFEVFYWRDGNNEVDFVLRKDGKVVALEVKSNHERTPKDWMCFVRSSDRMSP